MCKIKSLFTDICACVCVDYFWKDKKKLVIYLLVVGSGGERIMNRKEGGLLFFLYSFASFKLIIISLYSISKKNSL